MRNIQLTHTEFELLVKALDIAGKTCFKQFEGAIAAGIPKESAAGLYQLNNDFYDLWYKIKTGDAGA